MSPASERRSRRSISAPCPALPGRRAIIGAALFGAAFAFIPADLPGQARPPHIVITTIMFDQHRLALIGYLLVDVSASRQIRTLGDAGLLGYAIVPHFSIRASRDRSASIGRDAVQPLLPAQARRRVRSSARDLAHAARLLDTHRSGPCDRRDHGGMSRGAVTIVTTLLSGRRRRHGGQRDPRRGAPAHLE